MADTNTIRTIGQFKSQLAGGGARPNLFEVQLTNEAIKGGANWDQERFSFLCKAASLPAQTITAIDVPFRGRIFKVAGDRTVDVWTVTVINDEDFTFRNAFEKWTELIAQLSNNQGVTSPASYMSDAVVKQLGRGAKPFATESDPNSTEQAVLKTYKFIDMFPTNISAIDLSYDSGDAIEEYTVEFAVNNIVIDGQ
tara:strand:- start:140 stop:727 length:588 start_codon:yes stop_codon:yes gene_type:complete